MGTSLGVADTMALIASKLTNLVPFSACALFLFDEPDDMLRCRFATGAEADAIGMMAIRAGQGSPAGSRATAGRWSTRGRAPNSRPPGSARRHSLRSALVTPLVFNDRFIGTLAVYHAEADFYTDDHRRLLDRVSEQASAVIHNSIVFEQTQEDSLTDPLTGPAEHALHVHAPLARAGAGRAHEVRSGAAGDGPRQLQGNQRHLRPPRRRPRAARGGAGAALRASAPTTSASATPATSSSSCWPGCGAEESERKRRRAAAGGRGRGVRAAARPARAGPHQRRRGDLPAGRRRLRGHHGHRRQPHVSRQDAAASRSDARGGARRPAPTADPGIVPPRAASRPTCRRWTSSARASACSEDTATAQGRRH